MTGPHEQPAPGGEPDGVPARLRRQAMYIGALLGPLGGGVVATMLPELAGSLHASRAGVAASLTVYFVPFALVQLVSGTLGERYGRRRVVRAAYLGYAVASLVCALAPTLGVFLLGRVLQGGANAFTSPLLVSGLADLVPAARLSRSIGVYGSFQGAGQSLAPLIGGAATLLDWRLAFLVVAAVSVALALIPPPGEPRPHAAAPPWRPLLTSRMGLLCTAGFGSYAGSAGLAFLVALYAHDRFAASGAVSGAVLVGYGVAGMLLGAPWGRVCQRYGARRAGIVAALAAAVLVVVVAVTPHAGVLAACWTCAGACTSLLNVSLQNLSVRELPANRGGAVSVVSAFRFAGSALAPTLWLPIYEASTGTGHGIVAFAAAGCCCAVLVAGSLALLRRR